jgi:hypothetical protein
MLQRRLDVRLVDHPAMSDLSRGRAAGRDQVAKLSIAWRKVTKLVKEPAGDFHQPEIFHNIFPTARARAGSTGYTTHITIGPGRLQVFHR